MYKKNINKDTEKIIAVLKEYKSNSAFREKISELGLFGSFATNRETKASDIDIFLELKPARMFDVIDIKKDLEGLLHKKVDLAIIRKAMNPFLKKQIENSGIYV